LCHVWIPDLKTGELLRMLLRFIAMIIPRSSNAFMGFDLKVGRFAARCDSRKRVSRAVMLAKAYDNV